jgi:Tfp pilus assembly protein FimT
MKSRRASRAFTLVELLTVIGIIILIAALVAPVITNFRKGDAMLAATRQMIDAVHRGRQLAISQHTTVYMVFAPSTLWTDNNYLNLLNSGSLTPLEKRNATNALDKQQTGYVYVSLRTVGDQPGRGQPRYLSQWQTLPDSSFIPSWKFTTVNPVQIKDIPAGRTYDVKRFDYVNFVPFPSEDAFYKTPLPAFPDFACIAFDYLGRLVDVNTKQPLGHDEYIPLAHGSVMPARDPTTRALQLAAPAETEVPPGNSTGVSFNLIHIDWLTGRARLEHQEVR